MTQSRFFQLSLGFPALLWCILLVIFSFIGRGGNDMIQKNLYDGYRIFVPYLFFAAVVWKLAGGKPYRILMLMSFFVPIAWGGFFTFFYMIAAFIKDHTVDKWYILCMMAFWAMLVAYLFEIIPYLILTFFKNDFASQAREKIEHIPVQQYPPAA